jgi:hypothetical protein
MNNFLIALLFGLMAAAICFGPALARALIYDNGLPWRIRHHDHLIPAQPRSFRATT